MVKVTLELRYGREDEELMGLQFCNEMVVIRQILLCVLQIFSFLFYTLQKYREKNTYFQRGALPTQSVTGP
jgi:hypothetical protein